MLAAALGAFVRQGFAWLAGYVVARGIWTSDAATAYVEASVLFVLALGWSLWQKYKDRLKFLSALTLPAGTSEAKAEEHAAGPMALPVNTKL